MLEKYIGARSYKAQWAMLDARLLTLRDQVYFRVVNKGVICNDLDL